MEGYIKIRIYIFCLLFLGLSVAAQTQPIIVANLETNPVYSTSGSDGYIVLNLRNSGNDFATNIKVSVVYADKGIKIKYETYEIDGLSPGDSTSIPIKYSIDENAENGIYQVKIKIEYCQNNICREGSQNALIKVVNQAPIIIKSVYPTELKVGKEYSLQIKISNKGNFDIKDVYLTLIDPSNSILTKGMDNRYYIPKISSKEDIDLIFNVSVSNQAIPSSYPIYLKIEYTDKANNRQTYNSTFGLKILNNVDFFVGLEEVSGNLITITIGNIGLTPAYSVSLEISNKSDSAKFIGNINPGDYTSVSFDISPINRNSKNLILDIYYTDDKGERNKIEKSIKLDMNFANITYPFNYRTQRTQSRYSENTQIINYVVFAAIIIFIIFLIRSFRKKR